MSVTRSCVCVCARTCVCVCVCVRFLSEVTAATQPSVRQSPLCKYLRALLVALRRACGARDTYFGSSPQLPPCITTWVVHTHDCLFLHVAISMCVRTCVKPHVRAYVCGRGLYLLCALCVSLCCVCGGGGMMPHTLLCLPA